MTDHDAAGPSDADLVASFVAGDDAAYADLVRRYERRVYGICFRYFGDATAAEDAVQNAFVILYRKADTFKGTAKFSTWLYRVATNACNDLVRKQSRRPQQADTQVQDLPIADPRDDISDKLLQLELRTALLQLDPDYREAVLAHTVRGEPYHEIAERAGVAVGTIKSRVHRGHAKLATILTANPEEPSGRSPPLT